MIGHASSYCRSHAEGLMYPDETVVHVVDRQRCDVIFDLLGECIGKSGEAADLHLHREILALHVAGGRVK